MSGMYQNKADQVAPLVGAWIETTSTQLWVMESPESLPSWERGLKPAGLWNNLRRRKVAPLVGAWIETTR